MDKLSSLSRHMKKADWQIKMICEAHECKTIQPDTIKIFKFTTAETRLEMIEALEKA